MKTLLMTLVAVTAQAAPLQVKAFAASDQSFSVTSTIISGEKEVVVIDAQFLESEAAKLAEQLKATGKKLTTIYVSHGHPDHYFGLATLHRGFPDAKLLAHPKVIAAVKAGWQPKHDQWKPMFKAEISDEQVALTPYDKPTLTLEGHRLELIGPGQGDAADSVAVWIPESKTLVTGDISYAGLHTWLADTTPAEQDAWLLTLKKLQALQPKVVISGHKGAAQTDDPANLAATAKYIEDFKAVVKASANADEVVKAMSAKYPKLEAPIILQLAAKQAFAGR